MTRHPVPPPPRTNDVRVVVIGTAAWAVAFLTLLPFAVAEPGRRWWLATCAVGFSLGLVGIRHCRRRDAAIARAEAAVRDAGAKQS